MSISEFPAASLRSGARGPLSQNQQFLCLFDQGDDAGPFGPRYHIAHAWRVRGPLDLEVLQQALLDLVTRHETLRTVVRRADGCQEVLAPHQPELVLRELAADGPAERDAWEERLLVEAEAGELAVDVLPHLRVVLGRFDAEDAVLVLLVHHTATDGWSMRVTMRDLAALYAARRSGRPHDLPDVATYREFAEWQQAQAAEPGRVADREYWRKNLAGARILTIPTDHPRSAGLGTVTAVHRFALGAGPTGSVLAAARTRRSSPFMAMMAAFVTLVRDRWQHPDITVPTFTPGRGPGGYEDTVGSFFNFLPLRTGTAGCRTFLDVLDRVRAGCLRSYEHDIPTMDIFAQAPELMAPAARDDAAPAVFQVFPFPFLLDDERVGDLTYRELRRRLQPQPAGSDVPDGMLWTVNLDPAGGIIGSVQYKSGLYRAETVRDLVQGFTAVLERAAAEPEAVLWTS